MKQFGIDVYRWSIGFAGSVAMIVFCKMIVKNKGQRTGIKILTCFGQMSLGIYILNSYTNGDVLLRLTGSLSPNVFLWIGETIVSMIVYSIVIRVIEKIPVTKKLLLGGR